MLIPYQHISIPSELNQNELGEKLQKSIVEDDEKFYWGKRFEKKFRGEIKGQNFYLVPIVPYWNLSPLRIKGKISANENGAVLKCKAIATFFKTISVMSLIIITTLLYYYFNDNESHYLWGILVVIASAYVLTAVPFYVELRKSIARLKAIASANQLE